MTPGVHSVARVRWAVRIVLRLALLVVILMAAWHAYQEVGFYRQQRQSAARGQSAGAPPLTSFLRISPRWLMIGALLLAADLLALRLLVPTPRRGCPGCGYDIDESKQERCPECGLELTKERRDD